MAITATLDKSTYNVGDTMTLTVKADAGERVQYDSLTGTVTVDIDGPGPWKPVVTPYTSKKVSASPSQVTLSDPSRTWTNVSDDGVTAVYTSKA